MPSQRRSLLALLLLTLIVLSSVAPVAAQVSDVHGIDRADMDLAVDPRVDFYRFANGGWLDRTTIPADRGSWGVFAELDQQTTHLLVDLLRGLADSGTLQAGTDEWKAVRIFEQGTDLAARNAQGLAPIQPQLDQIDAISDLPSFHRYLQSAVFQGATGLFPIYVGSDLKDSSINAAYLGGPWLGLPNRDYYLDDDAANQKIRAAYVDTSAKLLGYLGYDEARAKSAAQSVYDLERKLAEPTLTREQQQDFSLSYNLTAIDQLSAVYPLMDWSGYLQALGIGDVKTLIVTELGYLKALDPIVTQTSLATLKDYLKLQILWSFNNNLDEAIERTAFEFNGGVLGGVTEMRPLDERVLGQVDGVMGEAVGKLYVAQTFPPEAKQQIAALVQELIASFRERLQRNDWMTPEAKTEALKKLANLGVKVGYPDKWRSYAAVEIGDSYATSVLNAANAEVRRRLAEVGKPVDKSEWSMSPQTVNAYYDQQNNEIVFPAAILQPPFFDYRADPASNFGAIGYVIGHEITHGFDLGGSQFDANGNLREWWTPTDRERFMALNDRVVKQYDQIEVLPGVFVNGQITVTENVADLGGIQVAYEALENYLAEHGRPLPPPPFSTDGLGQRTPFFSQEQRFFIAAATVWRSKIREAALLTRVKSDVHAPPEIRATQPLRNADAFFAAFAIGPSDPMYFAPADRVVIW